jgi:hypothetical protein
MLASSQPDQPAPPVAQDDEVTVVIDVSADASVVEAEPAVSPSFAPEIEPVVVDAATMRMRHQPRRNLLQRMRDWLRRAA